MARIERVFRVVICLVLSVQLFICACHTAKAEPIYDAEASVAYANAHWNDGVGVCDEFVKACLAAGGIHITVGYVMNVYNALLNYGTSHELVFRNSYCYESDNSGHAEPGDIIFWRCQACADEGFPRPWPHTAIIDSIDESGRIRYSAHNSAKHNALLGPSFSHKSPVNGTTHSGSCISHYVVHIPSRASLTPLDLGDSFDAHIIFKHPWRLAVVDSSNNNVHIEDETRRAVEDWHMERQSDGTYIISSLYNGYVLDVEWGGTADGTNVRVYPKTDYDNPSQKWYVVQSGDGYRLSPQSAPSKALDVAGGDFSTGSNIQIYEYNGNDAQVAWFYRLDYVAPTAVSTYGFLNMNASDEVTLRINYAPNGVSMACTGIFFSSSNPDVASVSAGGVVKALRAGTTTIRCTSAYSDRVYCECSVTVSMPFSEDGSAMPDSLIEIEEEAFARTLLWAIRLPEGCEKIGKRAFAESDSLRYLLIPDSVTSISPDAFEDSVYVTVFCHSGSTAESYAKRNNLKYHILTD